MTLGAGARSAARAAGTVVALLSIAALASACDGSSAPTPSPTDTLLAIDGAGAGGSDGSGAGEGAASSGEGSASSSQLGAAGTCPVGRWVMDNESWAAALGESWEGRVGFQKGSVASGETCAATPEVSAQESGTRLLNCTIAQMLSQQNGRGSGS